MRTDNNCPPPLFAPIHYPLPAYMDADVNSSFKI